MNKQKKPTKFTITHSIFELEIQNFACNYILISSTIYRVKNIKTQNHVVKVNTKKHKNVQKM